jgi:hypothetical protein
VGNGGKRMAHQIDLGGGRAGGVNAEPMRPHPAMIRKTTTPGDARRCAPLSRLRYPHWLVPTRASYVHAGQTYNCTGIHARDGNKYLQGRPMAASESRASRERVAGERRVRSGTAGDVRRGRGAAAARQRRGSGGAERRQRRGANG